MKKRLILMTMSFALLVGGATIIYGEENNDVGSETNPLVTLKYVEGRIEQLKYYIDQNIEIFRNENNALKENIANTQTTNQQTANNASTVFNVVEVKAGQKLICGQSAEVIWRSGNATVIASELGGLTDVTVGKNLSQGEEVTKDHLIIVPRGDGRGMNVIVDSYVMVKGEYSIE